MISPCYEERVAAAIMLDEAVSAFPDFEISVSDYSLPIEWESISARSIRRLQSWLSSDCCVFLVRHDGYYRLMTLTKPEWKNLSNQSLER